MTKHLLPALAAATFACLSDTASADTVTMPPIGLNQYVSANDRSVDNLWTGLAQSVTARDTAVQFGFYLINATGSQAPDSQVIYTLREGDGIGGRVLKQMSVRALEAQPDNSILTMADFSDISLTIGERYTFTATVPVAIDPGRYSAARLSFSSLENEYRDGRFYYIGANYTDFYSDWDLAFSMVGVSAAAIPEPTSWAMMIGGFGVAGTALRRRGSAVARPLVV